MSQPPPPPPPPSGPAYYPQQVVIFNQPTSGLAVFSGIAGILSWFLCPFLGALAAIITGFIALGDIRRTGRPGRGWALTGVILGFAHLAIYGFITLLFMLGVFGSLLMLSQPSPTP